MPLLKPLAGLISTVPLMPELEDICNNGQTLSAGAD